MDGHDSASNAGKISQQSETPHSEETQGNNAVCDRCDQKIKGLRYNCQACQEFDYCSECVADAPLIHPGHAFKTINSSENEGGGDEASGVGQDGNRASNTNLVGSSAVESSEPREEHQCQSCASITMHLATLSFILQSPNFANLDTSPRELSLRWPLRISRLVEATQRGCAFCAFVLTKFFGPSNGISLSYRPEQGPWYADPSMKDSERKCVVDHCMTSLTRLKHDGFIFSVTPGCSRKGGALPDFDTLLIAVESLLDREKKDVQGIFSSAGVLEVKVNVYAAKDNPAAAHLSRRPPNPSPASDEGMEQARVWMRECEKHHGPSCGFTDKTSLPARVIDVRGPHLRLHQTAPGETGKYATLSYWHNKPPTFQTITDNFEENLSSFSLDALPKAFKDAVVTVQNLGIPYLWIDSICLIQDSDDDKARGASQKASIYKSAHVTISAASCNSAEDSFLQSCVNPDTGLWRTLVPLKYPIPHPEAKTTEDAFKLPRASIGTIWLLDEDTALSSTISDPVESDAWTLQERILSRRLLSYGRWPTWRCAKGIQSDGGYYLETKSGPEQRKLLGTLLRTSVGSADLFMTIQVQKSWQKILNQYTRCELEHESDMLSAIGGIASEIGQITGGDYLAGLWKNNMLYDVMWYADTREWLSRPQKWRAPTWSWASVKAPVSYGAIPDDATPLATVHSCSVSPAVGHTEFGEVSSGLLEISGPFAELQREDVLRLFAEQNMGPPPPKSNRVSDWYKQLLEHMANQPKQKITAEEAEAALPKRTFGLLTFSAGWRMKHEVRTDETCYSGLLLRETDNGNFERIGAFKNEILGWLDQERQSWPTRKVVLV